MNLPLALIGAWIVFDGLVSIIVYRKQRWYEHIIRIIRSGAGGLIILWSL